MVLISVISNRVLFMGFSDRVLFSVLSDRVLIRFLSWILLRVLAPWVLAWVISRKCHPKFYLKLRGILEFLDTMIVIHIFAYEECLLIHTINTHSICKFMIYVDRCNLIKKRLRSKIFTLCLYRLFSFPFFSFSW